MKTFLKVNFSLLILLAASLHALTFKNNSRANVHFSVNVIQANKGEEWLGYVYVPAGGEIVKHFNQLKHLPSSFTVKGTEGGVNIMNYYILGGREFVCGQYGMGFGDLNDHTFIYQDGKCKGLRK